MEHPITVTPILIQKIYAKHGKQISLELAAQILEILERFADLAFKVYDRTPSENL